MITFLKQIEEIYEMKSELNQILENLEESIMIVTIPQYKADFINQRFLSSFAKDIIHLLPIDTDRH